MTNSFIGSILIHCLMVLLFCFASWIKDVFHWTTVKRVPLAIRVDVVDMPKQTLQELKNLARQKELRLAREEKKESPTMALKTPKKNVDLDKLLNTYAKKKVIKQEAQPQAQKKERLSEIWKKMEMAGNKLSAGSRLSPTDDYSENQVNARLAEYADSVVLQRVRQYWRVPDYLLKSNFQCRVRIFLRRDGYMYKYSLIEPSHNDEYDSRAVNALKMANPFEPLPQEIVAEVEDNGITLGFPL